MSAPPLALGSPFTWFEFDWFGSPLPWVMPRFASTPQKHFMIRVLSPHCTSSLFWYAKGHADWPLTHIMLISGSKPHVCRSLQSRPAEPSSEEEGEIEAGEFIEDAQSGPSLKRARHTEVLSWYLSLHACVSVSYCSFYCFVSRLNISAYEQ